MARFKLIETPDILLEYWDEYVKDLKSKPTIVKDWVGKDATDVYREKEKPLTLQRFEVWMYKEKKINVGQYFDNQDNRYNDYIAICAHIKKERDADQIEGGMTGIYNANITARLNGLVDKKETEVKGGLNIPNLPNINDR